MNLQSKVFCTLGKNTCHRCVGGVPYAHGWKNNTHPHCTVFTCSIKTSFCTFCIYCWHFLWCLARTDTCIFYPMLHACLLLSDNESNHKFNQRFNECLAAFGLCFIKTILSGIISIVFDWRNEFLKCLVSLTTMTSCDISSWALSGHWIMIQFIMFSVIDDCSMLPSGVKREEIWSEWFILNQVERTF